MNIYRERAHLLALLAMDVPALGFTPTDAKDGFSRGLALQIGGRWLTWHIADEDLDLFDHVPFSETFEWDGHTTDEKYEVIRNLLKDH